MEPNASSRLKVWSRRSAIGLAAVVVVAAIGHRVWTARAQGKLDRTLANLRAAGEPVAATDLTFGSVPDVDNASLDYQRAGALVKPDSAAQKAYDGATVDDPAAFALPWTAAERAMADAVCVDGRPALAAVDAARGKRPGPWHDTVDTWAMPAMGTFNASRELSNLLTTDATRLATAGDAAGAVARLDDAVALADAAQRRPALLGHLVALGLSEAAYAAIDRVLPTVDVTPANRPAVLALLARLQDERPSRDGARLGFQCERVFAVQASTDVANGTAGKSNELTIPGPLRVVLRPLLLTDAALAADDLTAVEHVVTTAPDWPAAQAALPTALAAQIAAHPMLHIGASMLVGGSHDKAVKVDFRALADRRLAAVAVAARLYAADHAGQLPQDLAALVPAYLPAVPTDAMDGQPMRFATNPPRAYSVGDDGTDDGGIPVDPTVPMRKQHGDDVAYLTTQPRKTPTTRP